MIELALRTAAEDNGYKAFHHRQAMTHREAEQVARREYNSVLLQECFVSGWNRANWAAMDEADEALRPGIIDADNSPA